MKKLCVVLMLVSLAIFSGCLTSSDDGGSKEGYQIYGYVNNTSGSPIRDVTLTLTQGGKTIATATTSGYGYYVFNDIPNGTYTVVPSKSGYKFTPSEVRNVVVSGDRTVVTTFVGSAN